jgi:hypothetical protein
LSSRATSNGPAWLRRLARACSMPSKAPGPLADKAKLSVPDERTTSNKYRKPERHSGEVARTCSSCIPPSSESAVCDRELQGLSHRPQPRLGDLLGVTKSSKPIRAARWRAMSLCAACESLLVTQSPLLPSLSIQSSSVLRPLMSMDQTPQAGREDFERGKRRPSPHDTDSTRLNLIHVAMHCVFLFVGHAFVCARIPPRKTRSFS